MKKLVAFLLAVTMLISFVACGETTVETTTGSDVKETTTAETTTAVQPTETTTAEPEPTETTTETPVETTTEKTDPPVTPSTPTFDADNVVLSFAALSDVHVNNAKEKADNGEYLKNAFKQLKEYAAIDDADGLDAILLAGDLTESYTYTDSVKTIEMDRFNKIYNSSEVSDIPFLFVLGNHDHDNGKSGPGLTRFLELQGNAALHQQYDVSCPDSGNGSRHAIIGDYHFLFVEPATYVASGADASGAKYKPETLAWLDETLADITAKNPDQYVFLLTHAMIYDTVYGSDLLTSGIFWYTKEIRTVLDKYPQVVTFSGHLHFPLNDPRSIMQDDFTSLGCGSVNYMAIENGNYTDMASATTMNDKNEFSQGLLVQVDANGNTRITRMDFHNNATIGEPWIIAAPAADNSHLTAYGKDRGTEAKNEAPVLSEVSVTFGKVNGKKQAATVVFAAAQDNDFAHHYQLVVVDKADGTTVETIKILSDFYRHGDPADMKKEYEQRIKNLTIGGEYEITVTAYDSWGAASAPVSCTVKVTGETSETPVSGPEVYVDFDFAGGQIVDTKGNVTIQNNGASAQKASVTHKGTSATVDALVISKKNDHVLCKFNNLTSATAVNDFAEASFTVEAFYVMNKKGGAVQGVVCGTQSGGWGVAEDKNGVPYFITGITGGKYNAGAYAKAASSTTELVHVVAVYDYEAEKNYIYINGVLEATTAITDGFCAGSGQAYNVFSLGNDVTATGLGGDFPTEGMVMVDAKIYKGALSAADVTTAYNTAVSALK